jgi:hypothetical protein
LVGRFRKDRVSSGIEFTAGVARKRGEIHGFSSTEVKESDGEAEFSFEPVTFEEFSCKYISR